MTNKDLTMETRDWKRLLTATAKMRTKHRMEETVEQNPWGRRMNTVRMRTEDLITRSEHR